MAEIKEVIESGRAVLGIEFGSTRIKAVLVDEENKPVAAGSHEWENRFENGGHTVLMIYGSDSRTVMLR